MKISQVAGVVGFALLVTLGATGCAASADDKSEKAESSSADLSGCQSTSVGGMQAYAATTDFTYIRNWPSADAAILGGVGAGESVLLVDGCPYFGWYHVEVHGLDGWIRADRLSDYTFG